MIDIWIIYGWGSGGSQRKYHMRINDCEKSMVWVLRLLMISLLFDFEGWGCGNRNGPYTPSETKHIA